MVAPGGMRGCSREGGVHGGGCMVAPGGVAAPDWHAWFFLGGICGFSGGRAWFFLGGVRRI